MVVIKNRWIPLKGYAAINLFGIIFVRKGVNVSARLLNHEKIHSKQYVELLFIGFLLWYVLEYLIRLVIYRNHDEAYRNISLEREAYSNDSNLSYIPGRKPYAFLKRLII